MPEGVPAAAEVRAARQAREGQPHAIRMSGPPPSTPAVPVQPRGNCEIGTLLTAMMSAEEIDIVGVMPWECTDRLIEMREHPAPSTPAWQPPAVRYITPSRRRFASYQHGSEALGIVVQRLIAGETGLKNWLIPHRGEVFTRSRLKIYEFDEIFVDCFICVRRRGVEEVTLLSRLPGTTTLAGSTDRMPTARLIATHLPVAQSAGFREYVDNLQTRSAEDVTRQVRCRSGIGRPSGPDGNEFEPVVEYLSDRGMLLAGDIEPTTAVAVCTITERGPAVVLKVRTRHNARDDFGMLSLVSERVLDEDFGDPRLPAPLHADSARALEQLWISAGYPTTFTVPEKVFRNTARRELFMSCGIDVAAERLKFCGTCLIQANSHETWLGFFVYRLDLKRSATEAEDEYQRMMAWNPNLVRVLVNDLFTQPNQGRLNRIMRHRENWFRREVLGTAPAGG